MFCAGQQHFKARLGHPDHFHYAGSANSASLDSWLGSYGPWLHPSRSRTYVRTCTPDLSLGHDVSQSASGKQLCTKDGGLQALLAAEQMLLGGMNDDALQQLRSIQELEQAEVMR